MQCTWTLGDYTIRSAAPHDAPAVTELERRCCSDPWTLERVEAFISMPHEGHEQLGLLATTGNQLVGYALLAIGGGSMSIEWVGVVPDQRRQRAGTNLVAAALMESRTRKLEFIVTILRESNQARRSSSTSAASGLGRSRGRSRAGSGWRMPWR